MQSFLHGIGEYLTPVLKDSKFKETGVLTPEEFVAAGDFLVYKCPTWSWASGEESKRRSYLPAEKQYLVTKNVPCLKRVKQMQSDAEATFEEDEEAMIEDGWLSTHMSTKTDNSAIKDIDNVAAADGSGSESSECDPDDIPDLEDFDIEDNLVEDDPGAFHEKEDEENILKTRTYDLTITYDKYYQTPRMWLFGYDEKGRALKPKQVFEDVSQDHAKKTVTIESHPHLDISAASVHPCKHSNVMKKIIDHLDECGKDLRVDQ